MFMYLFRDERGAMTIDWVTLTAGILVVGIIIVYAVMNDSAGFLLDEFESLNQQYDHGAAQVAVAAQQIEFNK